MGEGTLDLSELRAAARRTTDVRATVGLGHLIVLVPEDQDAVVNTEVGAGEVVVFGEQQNGVGFETHEAYAGERRHADPRPRGGHGPDRGAPRRVDAANGRARPSPAPRPCSADGSRYDSTARAIRSVPKAVRIAR